MKQFLSSKIHKAIITEADLNYIGSITIDRELMELTELEEGQKVLVVDNTNGARLETYVIPGIQGQICMNWAAAHLMNVGDEIIIMGFALSDTPLTPKSILVNEKNEFVENLQK